MYLGLVHTLLDTKLCKHKTRHD